MRLIRSAVGERVPFNRELGPCFPGGRVGCVARQSLTGERLVPVFPGDIDHGAAPHAGGSMTPSVTDNGPKIAVILNQHPELRDVPDFAGRGRLAAFGGVPI